MFRKYLTPLAIREIKTKIALRTHLILVKISIIKTNNSDEDTGKTSCYFLALMKNLSYNYHSIQLQHSVANNLKDSMDSGAIINL